MSSMDVNPPVLRPLFRSGRALAFAMVLLPSLLASVACHASDGSEWDRARNALIASQPGAMGQAVQRWQLLTSSNRFSFDDYAGFVLAYPGFPDEDKLRRNAEAALDTGTTQPSRLVAFFDRAPPLTNPARAQYALALRSMGRPEAASVARAAWRGGPMSDTAEAALVSTYGASFTPDDQDARMDALLWAGAQPQAERQLGLVSPARRGIDAARLATLAGADPFSTGTPVDATALNSDPGYIYLRVRQLRKTGQGMAAQSLLATRPRLARQPLNRDKWVDELLVNARSAAASGSARSAIRIAASIDDAFSPGEDISQMAFDLRDDYTSLMWLGGSQALWQAGSPADAAPLFYRYGAAARTPGTKSKGFYWAGYASAQAGRSADAQGYFAAAARYGDQFYGQLSLERLGQPVPHFTAQPTVTPTPEERAAFQAAPLTQAVREVARSADWKTSIRFFKEISERQVTEGQHLLVAELARNLGRRDLGVIVGGAAGARGYLDFQHIAFPLIPVPADAQNNWTMVHAITRQESQFAQNALSHAGARGLMQLMPGTANEQANKLGLSYSSNALMDDPTFNIRVGSAYFQRLVDYFGGSLPLAVAAYNAGAGNVNKWLRSNGDPRNGGIGWIEWVERIPITETRGYVQHVMENAVVYEAMNPDHATYNGPNPLSHFLGKRTPG
ncbi:lytic transglycosylase domain-containing protein [Novosphingobium lentum]|uniref:lytic transglycosylase domain-containing protein n=1 Tax=Novosphingobium lentum TaxID=145287 RepID=UPI00082FB28A|nr:lytic transglycosylase domain-containing protein [Novosphingobium lentum]